MASMVRLVGLGLVSLALAGCKGDTTVAQTTGQDTGDAVGCAALGPSQCDAEPACRRLVAGQSEATGEQLCLTTPVDLACVPVDACTGGQACLACEGGEDDGVWVEDCACLPEGWEGCGAAISDPAVCECVDDSDCHPAFQCHAGQCGPCGPLDACGGCEIIGCPDGYCCAWEDYCTPGAANEGVFCGQDDPPPNCEAGECGLIDVLIVVDNSASMGEEQGALGPTFDALIDALWDIDDDMLTPDVNIMVTSTDMGHPLCDALAPPDYAPLAGAPQTLACVDRLAEFEPGGGEPSMADACLDACPIGVTPVLDHIHFAGSIEGEFTTNTPGNNVKGALRCLGPQGVVGCDYSSPLEAMRSALDPLAAWNQGQEPFLRDNGVLAIVLITDSYDCSVRDPEGFAYFTDPASDQYWALDPETMTKTAATPAVCWNAGVDCGAPGPEGVYTDCSATDTGVLHPVSRYLDHLDGELRQVQAKQIVMLSVSGVPPVTAHSPEPPFEPSAGGVEALVYRDWRDQPYPEGDILPGDPGAAEQTFETGIGPGCTGEDGRGGFTGQALPPVRVRELCEGIDVAAGPEASARCCMESICASDYSSALACLPAMIELALVE